MSCYKAKRSRDESIDLQSGKKSLVQFEPFNNFVESFSISDTNSTNNALCGRTDRTRTRGMRMTLTQPRVILAPYVDLGVNSAVRGSATCECEESEDELPNQSSGQGDNGAAVQYQ